MKISNSKKQLAKIIHENGGWRDGAESAAQCIKGEISFWHDVATKRRGEDWCGSYLGSCEDIEFTGVKLPNWHQTVLSRDEYFFLYPAPDAGGWVEWDGGECPVAGLSVVDVKYFDVEGFVTGIALDFVWGPKTNIVYYRKTRSESEQSAQEPKPVPAPGAEPTIEQLAADYRNHKDYADRKQREADAAKADAETKLAELVAVGRALGLVLSIAGAVGVEPEPEPVITEVRDLLVGDEVRCVNPNGGLVEAGSVGVVVDVHRDKFLTDFPEQRRYVYFSSHLKRGDVVFIRRPAKGGADA